MNLSIEPPKVYLVWDDAFSEYILGIFSSEDAAVQFASNYDVHRKLWLEVWSVDGDSRRLELRVLDRG